VADVHTPAIRSFNMSRIRGKDTSPELILRSALHRAGLRFRLHRKDLPGKPDIVLVGPRIAVFVHGCFWHRHPDCRYATWPTTNTAFWQEKFARTVERDREAVEALERLGWHVIVAWECEIRRDAERIAADVRGAVADNGRLTRAATDPI
jgi:DNA mismatch endonuclease (patch repair protein)